MTTNITTKPNRDITNPAIANPLGCLNIHIAENTNPSNHRIQFNAGIQDKNIATKDSTKPAIPIPFDFFSGTWT